MFRAVARVVMQMVQRIQLVRMEWQIVVPVAGRVVLVMVAVRKVAAVAREQ